MSTRSRLKVAAAAKTVSPAVVAPPVTSSSAVVAPPAPAAPALAGPTAVEKKAAVFKSHARVILLAPPNEQSRAFKEALIFMRDLVCEAAASAGLAYAGVLIRLELLPRLARVAAQNSDPVCVLNALWTLSNVASGTVTDTTAVCEADAIPAAIQHVTAMDADIDIVVPESSWPQAKRFPEPAPCGADGDADRVSVEPVLSATSSACAASAAGVAAAACAWLPAADAGSATRTAAGWLAEMPSARPAHNRLSFSSMPRTTKPGNLVPSSDTTPGDVTVQCLWLLGNVAGEGGRFQEAVLAAEAAAKMASLLEGLLGQLHALAASPVLAERLAAAQAAGLGPDLDGGPPFVPLQPRVHMCLRKVAWVSSNLTKKVPPAAFQMLKPLLAQLGRLLTSADQEMVSDTLWCMAFASDRDVVSASSLRHPRVAGLTAASARPSEIAARVCFASHPHAPYALLRTALEVAPPPRLPCRAAVRPCYASLASPLPSRRFFPQFIAHLPIQPLPEGLCNPLFAPYHASGLSLPKVLALLLHRVASTDPKRPEPVRTNCRGRVGVCECTAFSHCLGPVADPIIHVLGNLATGDAKINELLTAAGVPVGWISERKLRCPSFLPRSHTVP